MDLDQYFVVVVEIVIINQRTSNMTKNNNNKKTLEFFEVPPFFKEWHRLYEIIFVVNFLSPPPHPPKSESLSNVPIIFGLFGE